MIFDLDQALAGEPVKLRNGTKAFVVCDLRRMGFKNPRLPLMVAHENSMGRGGSMLTTAEGSYTYDSTQDPRDIVGMWFEPPVSPNVGHVHQALMAQYAEDAKTTDKPWELWEMQIMGIGTSWTVCLHSPNWDTKIMYRRKPKTKLIHGVEISDIAFIDAPPTDTDYCHPNLVRTDFITLAVFDGSAMDLRLLKAGMCYPDIDVGRAAAAEHTQALLGIHPDQIDKSNDS